MADQNGNGKAVYRDFLARLAVGVVMGIGGGALAAWADGQRIQSQIIDHERRLNSIEDRAAETTRDAGEMHSDVAVLKEGVETLKQDTRDIKQKLDELIRSQLNRQPR